MAAAWSPDGNQIAVIGYEPTGVMRVIVNLDGTRQRILAEFVDPEPWTSILASSAVK